MRQEQYKYPKLQTDIHHDILILNIAQDLMQQFNIEIRTVEMATCNDRNIPNWIIRHVYKFIMICVCLYRK